MMRKQVLICVLAALVIGIVSCKPQQNGAKTNESSSVIAGDNSKNSLDWEGSYSAILPCDDCGGIQISVDLNVDGTYKMKEVYFGKEDSDTDVSGKLTWDKGGNSITVGEGQSEKKFLVGEGMLYMLDKDGNKMTGEQLDSYALVKTDLNLVEKYWRLTELLGEPVTTPEGAKEAHMILKKEDNRVTGTSGCNTFNGSFTLKPFNRITFSRSISTMMMCPNMETETKLYKVLETADSYTIKDDVLVLIRGRMAPLARFEAVYVK